MGLQRVLRSAIRQTKGLESRARPSIYARFSHRAARTLLSSQFARRAAIPQSRALQFPTATGQYASLRFKSTFPRQARVRSPSEIAHLQSRFPTKTVIALVVIGGLIYYLVEVDPELALETRLFNVFSSDSLVLPFHDFRNLEELEHHLQHHSLDFADPELYNPEAIGIINREFDKMAFGWMTTEEEAGKAGIPLTHGCRFRSNEPCEDYFALGTAPGPGAQPWNFWGVYDGHAGRYTANYLQWSLIPHVSRALSTLDSSSSSPTIHQNIMQSFVRLDNDMMNRAKHAGNWYPPASGPAITALTPAFSGSCALLSMYDPNTTKLRVACVGDSRAVLGRWDPIEEKYTCKPLSADQTGFNQSEFDRITGEHPDEEGILDPKTGRLLGIAVTRAFGDHRWKWDNEFIKQLQYKFWGPAPRPNSKTPPYMTAEPVITETDIVAVDSKSRDRNHKSDFLIMASDGLWDRISSDHAVELVHRWLEARDRGNGSVHNDPRYKTYPFPDRLQADPGLNYSVDEGRELDWKATPEYFTIEDDNAAVCLARNAMGGSRKGLFLGLVSIGAPFCRSAVDDTTIMVVFFDKLDSEKKKKK